MTYYRIDVHPLGPMATDLVSGTLWGQIAWAVRYLEGEKALADWLVEQQERHWLVSSQMPAGMIPKPLLEACFNPPSDAQLEQMQASKAVNKKAFISEPLFLKLRHRLSDENLVQALVEGCGAGDEPAAALDSIFIDVKEAHNRINRITGRTPSTGGLFFHDATFGAPNARMQVFIQTPEPCDQRLQGLLEHIGNNGFGANASTGSGTISFAIQRETSLFEVGGTRAMSLFHGIITPNMARPRYKLHTHFGKLGGHFAVGGYRPFKYPILMVQPGATFRPEGSGPFGRLLDGVPHDPELSCIRHHALHLPLAFTEVPPCK